MRYVSATILSDHFCAYIYFHLMKEMDVERTVESKNAFERTLKSFGVKVSYYHAENILSYKEAFKVSISTTGQGLKIYVVNAIHHNGKAENKIKYLTMGARNSLIHIVHCWSKALDA